MGVTAFAGVAFIVFIMFCENSFSTKYQCGKFETIISVKIKNTLKAARGTFLHQMVLF